MSVHAWCSDPARDEAVRAAEDNRQGPLPTLEEVIAQPFADQAKGSPAVSETGETQSGLRTERVVLEITQRADRFQELAAWDWPRVLDGLDRVRGESVRVVEEEDGSKWDTERHHYEGHIAALKEERDAAIRERDDLRKECERRLTMCEEMKRDRDSQQFLVSCLRARVDELESAPAASVAANSPAEPKGSEPDAWGVMRDGGVAFVSCRSFRRSAENFAYQWGGKVVPLFTSPLPAPGWLTEEEREAVEWLLNSHGKCVVAKTDSYYRGIVSALLARSTPPDVELPPMVIAYDDMDMLKEALAAAGVKVKEVGRE